MSGMATANAAWPRSRRLPPGQPATTRVRPLSSPARGATIAVIRLPSIDGFFSTLATSSRACRTSCMTRRPSSMCGQLAAAEEDVDQHLVLVLEELAGPLDLDLDVVVAGLGADADLLDLDLVLLLLARSASSAEYLNFPKSMILQTGGRSLGATSTRSSPASRAASRALPVGMTPSITPSALITRTGEMRICSLTRMPRSTGAFRSLRSLGPMASSSGTWVWGRAAGGRPDGAPRAGRPRNDRGARHRGGAVVILQRQSRGLTDRRRSGQGLPCPDAS